MNCLIRCSSVLLLSFLSVFTFAVECKGIPNWSSTAVYTAGKQVQYQAVKYEAKWWTQGNNPAQSGQWDVWRNLGKCDSIVASSSRSNASSSVRSSTVSSSRSSSSTSVNSGGRVAAIPVGIEN